MKNERIDGANLAAMEQRLGCKFCDDGIFAEMVLDLESYAEKTAPVAGVEFGFFSGDYDVLRRAVAEVDDDWVQYFTDGSRVLCGFVDGRPVSFCIVEPSYDCILSGDGVKIGGPGCVGTVPQYRNRGIGLRMVDLATVWLKNEGFDKSYIHYTYLDKWYAKLGYHTIARFDFPK